MLNIEITHAATNTFADLIIIYPLPLVIDSCELLCTQGRNCRDGARVHFTASSGNY
jgi:hypothetical protein